MGVNCVPRSVVVQRTVGILVAAVLAVLAVLVHSGVHAARRGGHHRPRAE